MQTCNVVNLNNDWKLMRVELYGCQYTPWHVDFQISAFLLTVSIPRSWRHHGVMPNLVKSSNLVYLCILPLLTPDGQRNPSKNCASIHQGSIRFRNLMNSDLPQLFCELLLWRNVKLPASPTDWKVMPRRQHCRCSNERVNVLSCTVYIYEYFVFLHCMCNLQSSLRTVILLIIKVYPF